MYIELYTTVRQMYSELYRQRLSPAGGSHLFVYLGIPVLDVRFVRLRGREKGNVLRAAQPVAGEGAHAFPPRFGNAVVAVDDAVSSGGDFGEQDRTRQVGDADGGFLQIRIAIVGNVGELERLDGKSLPVSVDKGQKPRYVEFENAVRKQLVARLGRAGLELRI